MAECKGASLWSWFALALYGQSGIYNNQIKARMYAKAKTESSWNLEDIGFRLQFKTKYDFVEIGLGALGRHLLRLKLLYVPLPSRQASLMRSILCLGKLTRLRVNTPSSLSSHKMSEAFFAKSWVGPGQAMTDAPPIIHQPAKLEFTIPQYFFELALILRATRKKSDPEPRIHQRKRQTPTPAPRCGAGPPFAMFKKLSVHNPKVTVTGTESVQFRRAARRTKRQRIGLKNH
ncbi:hypothetical protein K438DRAFT_1754214 [Mycena galopus ATCC 62051]|nr:hypothetical protein K438DRAFT_1754214 [Mycena galopus ATCC 62051]